MSAFVFFTKFYGEGRGRGSKVMFWAVLELFLLTTLETRHTATPYASISVYYAR